jgi:hypothetical protein
MKRWQISAHIVGTCVSLHEIMRFRYSAMYFNTLLTNFVVPLTDGLVFNHDLCKYH